MEAAKRFFKHALAVVGHAPERVTTDGHTSYPRAVRETLGSSVHHRTKKYLNNRLEQDHRGIKQRYYLMLSFGIFNSAAVSVVLLTNYATIGVHDPLWENLCPFQNNADSFVKDLLPCKSS